MQSLVDYLLDGLEKALELERELGIRSVEIDRGLLGVAAAPKPRPVPPVAGPSGEGRETRDTRPETGDARPDTRDARPDTRDAKQAADSRTVKQSENHPILPLVFLHDRPLSEKGVEMMAKILNALGRPETPIVVVPPAPAARITVVLGGRALKKYFPGMKGEPGQWQKTQGKRDVLITYSPEYILRFGAVTPAVEKIKQDMWRSLKAVRQRLNG